MEMEAGRAAGRIPARDVQAELQFLQERVRALARGRASADLDDIATEAWIRLDRVLRRESARNVEALMTSVAWRAWVDYCRRKTTETKVLDRNVDVKDLEIEIPAEERGVDPHALRLWRFAIYEWFNQHDARCLPCAQLVFAGRTWVDGAAWLNEKPNSLAKRWQRCREHFLAAARADHGQLRELLDYFEGLAP